MLEQLPNKGGQRALPLGYPVQLQFSAHEGGKWTRDSMRDRHLPVQPRQVPMERWQRQKLPAA